MVLRDRAVTARLRGRRRRRGAAMVETAFMLPMFVILWYSSLYVHGLGSKHIGANTDARADAWRTAMANCGVKHDSDSENFLPPVGGSIGLGSNGSSDTSGAVSNALKNGNLGGALSGFVSNFTSVIASVFPNPNGAQVTKTDVINWRVPDLYNKTGLNNQDTNVTGTTTVVCNEAPMDGSIGNVAGALLNIIEGLVKMF
jgi:hypothetical protein